MKNLGFQNGVKNFYITKCHQDCRNGSSGHFHCPFCKRTIVRRQDSERHIQTCRRPAEEPPTKRPKNPQNVPRFKEETSSRSGQGTTTKPDQKQKAVTPERQEGTPLPAGRRKPSGHDNPACRVGGGKPATVLCPHCEVPMMKKNIRKHIYRRHLDKAVEDITAHSHLDAVCIDEENGIYAVRKSFLEPFVPLHVQKKTWGKEHKVKCDSNECIQACAFAVRVGMRTFQCHHVRSLDYCKENAVQTVLQEEKINEMVKKMWFGEEEKQQCLQLQSQAATANVPVSVDVSMKSEHKLFVSVYEPSVSYCVRLGRVIVTYDKRTNTWHCPCTKPSSSCIHKYMAKWHLFETHVHLFRKEPSTEMKSDISEQEPSAENMGIAYPPEDDQLQRMVSYIHSSKRYPAVLPDDVLSVQQEGYPVQLFPLETLCSTCPEDTVLGPPILITSQAQIVSLTGVQKGVNTYCKQCSKCGMLYRYQEYHDGLHNFDDGVILTLNLCIFLRNSLQAHTAVGQVFDALEETFKTPLPSRDRLLHAYLHFEALTAHEYKYYCVNCGYFPSVVVMDRHEKGVFSMPFCDIEPVPGDFTGDVNSEDFWDCVSAEMIAWGLTSSDSNNPFTVHPSYHFWAPWIGQGTRRSDVVLNTEFLKAPGGADDINATEDRLTNQLMNLKVDAVRTLCKECGVDSNGSKIDLILRLRTKMQNKQDCNKVFEKICGASGGLAAIMCPCGIVYSLKFNIRAEGPRDFADMLLAWKHLPNVSVYDSAQALVNHTSGREPENLPFQPHEGRLAPPTPENIQAAKDRTLKIHLPWILEPNTENVEDDSHPCTKSSHRYVLCDKPDEDNGKDEKDILRRIDLVPELAGQLDSKVAEQFFTEMRKNDYFLKNMSPSACVFLVRNMVHHHNEKKERQSIEKMKRSVWEVGSSPDSVDNSASLGHCHDTRDIT
ncbi:HMG domain-containing protein 3 isoform X3 [Labrus bergylta]|uniref:HMG domain-containing protein 3 isoform X3 n=1 Tax=Labrus bergylta TaxID=56723 RepID=UPI00331405C3